MRQTPEAVQQHLAERLCGQAAYRDDWRVARRLDHPPVVDGVYQLDEGAWLDDFFDVVQALGVGDWRGDIQGTAIQRERVPIVQDVLRYGLTTRLGIASRQALPAWLCRDEARMRLGGCKAPQVRHGGCQRGAAQRPGPSARRRWPIPS